MFLGYKVSIPTFVIMGLLVGCSGAPEPPQEPEEPEGPVMNDLPKNSVGFPGDDYYPTRNNLDTNMGPCGASKVVQLKIDGGVVTANVPIPCNPDWIYMGDPSPLKQ